MTQHKTSSPVGSRVSSPLLPSLDPHPPPTATPRRGAGGRGRFVLSLGLALALVAWLAVGCTQTFQGVSPDPHKIHYPIGLAVHPEGKFLYVANSNFDLAYTGGTVMVLDTDESKTRVFSVDGVKTELVTLQVLKEATVEIGSFAAQMVLNRKGDRAFVAVRQDRPEGSSIDVSSLIALKIDASKTNQEHLSCDQKAIDPKSTGGIGEEERFTVDGTTSGEPLSPAPRCADSSKLLMKDNPYPFGLALDYGCLPRKHCQKDSDCPEGQRCDYQTCVTGCSTDKDCPSGDVCDKHRCRASQPTGKACQKDRDCPEGQRCDQQKCAKGCQSDSECAGEDRCDRARCRYPVPLYPPPCAQQSDCQSWQSCAETRLLVTHLEGEGLSVISFLPRDLPPGAPKTNGLPMTRVIKGLSNMPRGMTGVALLPPNTPLSGAGEAFLVSRRFNRVFILPSRISPRLPGDLFGTGFSNVDLNSEEAADLRSVTVGMDRDTGRVRLYVASRRPSALLVYDIERDPQSFAVMLSLVQSVPICLGTSQVLYRARPSPQPDLLYLVCSNDRKIHVLDARTLQTLHRIRVGVHPYYMAIYDPPSASAPLQWSRAYVANFLDSTLSIIDLKTHRLIGRVEGIDTNRTDR